MAHTIRGIVNHFRKRHIELDVRVIPDTYGIIPLNAPREGTTSVMMSKFVQRAAKTERDRLYASIFIHQNANKHLARVCIAHEIYHLLLELDALQSDRKAWPVIPFTRAIEDSCNHFAWELCRLHDEFNKDDSKRKTHILFPINTFQQPFNMNDSTDWIIRWPDGFALDPTKPFWK